MAITSSPGYIATISWRNKTANCLGLKTQNGGTQTKRICEGLIGCDNPCYPINLGTTASLLQGLS